MPVIYASGVNLPYSDNSPSCRYWALFYSGGNCPRWALGSCLRNLIRPSLLIIYFPTSLPLSHLVHKAAARSVAMMMMASS